MENENVIRLREAYDAFLRGDLNAVAEGMTDDAVWHVTGEGPLTGDYKGPGEIIAYFGKLFETLGGNLQMEVEDVMASDRHATALVHIHAERAGRIYDQDTVHLFEIEDGKVKSFRQYEPDPVAAEAFWA